MPTSYTPVEMDIGSGRTVAFNVRSDIATYFGITAMSNTTAAAPKLRRRKAHTRQLYKDGLADTTSAATTSVPAAEWYVAGATISEIGTGKAIILPTKLRTPKGHIRTATIRVPGNASMLSIARWIATKFGTTNKPDYFLTPSGQRHPTAVGAIADPNPGNAPTTAPAPAP